MTKVATFIMVVAVLMLGAPMANATKTPPPPTVTVGTTPTVSTTGQVSIPTPQTAGKPSYTCTNDDCTQTSWCDLYDADCVTAYADYGYGQDYAVTSNDISNDWDAYGSGGATCNWIAIVDYWYAYVFNTYSWVGVLQAYVCHRGQVVTRFDQLSAFAVQLFGLPWTLAYHLDYSVPTPPQQPDTPTYYTSTTAGLSVSVCAWFKPLCSYAHPRYVIQWNSGHITCFVNGYPFDDCVGHRYR